MFAASTQFLEKEEKMPHVIKFTDRELSYSIESFFFFQNQKTQIIGIVCNISLLESEATNGKSFRSSRMSLRLR